MLLKLNNRAIMSCLSMRQLNSLGEQLTTAVFVMPCSLGELSVAAYELVLCFLQILVKLNLYI